MEASEWDHATLREEEFEQHAVYLVPDVSASPGDTNRAEASLPRNLVLKPSQALNDVCSFAEETYPETSSVGAAVFSRESYQIINFLTSAKLMQIYAKKNDNFQKKNRNHLKRNIKRHQIAETLKFT